MAGSGTGPVDFYFDFSSPYGYFAAHRIDAIAKRWGRAVEWEPILLGLVFEVSGGRPLPSIPMKGDYARVDVRRTARFHGIAWQQPSKFPASTGPLMPISAATSTVTCGLEMSRPSAK